MVGPVESGDRTSSVDAADAGRTGGCSVAGVRHSGRALVGPVDDDLDPVVEGDPDAAPVAEVVHLAVGQVVLPGHGRVSGARVIKPAGRPSRCPTGDTGADGRR